MHQQKIKSQGQVNYTIHVVPGVPIKIKEVPQVCGRIVQPNKTIKQKIIVGFNITKIKQVVIVTMVSISCLYIMHD